MTTLGENDEDILLDTADENRQAIVSLARQARSSLSLFTTDLDPRLFDDAEFERCLFELARQHKSTQVRILVADSSRAVSQGHCLIRLAQRLTSAVAIHNPAKQHRNEPATFMIVDEIGLLHRPHTTSTSYEAVVNYKSPHRARELNDYFNEMWERSTPDSGVRRLYI